MKAKIVVDLMFGDSGKGMIVDHLVSKCTNPIVVKYTGGPQCGHTVIRDRNKHIFATFGSGSLLGAPTFLSEHCCFSPSFAWNEYRILQGKIDKIPKLYIHPLTTLITPHDIAYNRLRARITGHGSCGMGVGAAMERNTESPYKLYAVDMSNEDALFQKVFQIEKSYDDLLFGMKDSDLSYYTSIVNSEMENFKEGIDKLKVIGSHYMDTLGDYEEIIFEGGQGILLDKTHGIFPNVTYGNTTCKNAMEICSAMGIVDVTVYYVTRCYQTRHGNGWMSNEYPVQLINNHEEINITNEWQGRFRVGEFDYDLVNYALSIDELYNEASRKELVVTCLDQRPEFFLNVSKLKSRFDKIWINEGASSGNISQLCSSVKI